MFARILKIDPFHVPAGSPKGGQFAPKEGGEMVKETHTNLVNSDLIA